MKTLYFALILILSSPEAWHSWLGIDVWAADQIGQGLLVCTLAACVWIHNKPAAILAGVFGISRTSCVAIWPNASDAAGSICDAQTGIPLTVGVLAVALYALGRMNRG